MRYKIEYLLSVVLFEHIEAASLEQAIEISRENENAFHFLPEGISFSHGNIVAKSVSHNEMDLVENNQIKE